MDIRFVITCIILVHSVSSVNCLTLVAKVSLGGVKGTVTYIQNGGDTTVTFNINGLKNNNTWQIRSIRMLYDRQDRCLDTILGTNYIGSTGSINTTGLKTEVITAANLPNLSSLTGRTFLLIDSITNARVCAVIEADEDHITASAKLNFVVGGTVYFRQPSSSSSSATSIFSNVFILYNTGTASNGTMKWEVYSGTLSDSISCSGIDSRYNPTGSSGVSCSNTSQGNCPIGDLSSKNSDLPIGASSESALLSVVDNNLPLSGSNSIIGKVLVVKAPNGTVLTCSKIVQYNTRRGVATFSRNGVKGTISLQQKSPLDITMVSVSLSGLNQSAGGYHIHKWPVPEKWSADQKVCENDYVSGHFNPFAIDTATDPAPTVGTNDQYEIGDLSSKFGLLTGLGEKADNYTDYNLPLFGINSVIGRSIVIHYNDGSRWVCATIEYVGNTITGVATFVYPVIGYVVFKQPNDIESDIADTMIYTALNYGQNTTRTIDHNWHIHINTIGSDGLVDSGRCMSVQGHYNPYAVDLTGNYVSQCSASNPLRCELGDLSGKHGKLSVRAASGIMQRDFFTDIDLPLTGDLNILGRSIVIHAANSSGARLSCANIYTIPNRKVVVKTGTWLAESTSSIDGSFTMERKTEGSIDGTTDVNIQLSGLASMAGGYHVHVNPVPVGSASPCSASSVGGHFNPFNVNATAGPIDGSGSDDQYEIGDLSRKYGAFLTGIPTFTRMEKETMLPLRGPLSITGRSVVIHKSSDGAPRWVCGNITEDSSTGGILFEAKASFTSGNINGSIYLTQYLYSDGGLSDTGILVDLGNKDGSITTGHKWHVHEKPVGDDATSGCLSPGGHYNPFMVDVNNNYIECSPTNPLRCELGDQSGKLGFYDIGSGRRFYTDVFLPLVGVYGVAGKSFVIHAANGTRLACADILPVNKVAPVTMSFEQHAFNKTSMVTTLAAALNTSPTNLAVSASSSTTSGCMSVSVYFTGKDAAALRSNLATMALNRDSKLGGYVGTTTCCAYTRTASVLCIIMIFIIQRMSLSL